MNPEPCAPLSLADVDVLAIGPYEDDNRPGVMFISLQDSARAVFLPDDEARALRDWLVARYGAPTP